MLAPLAPGEAKVCVRVRTAAAGAVLTLEFSAGACVGDLMRAVAAAGRSGGRSFVLKVREGGGMRTLEDASKSLVEAHLANAQVVQVAVE